MLEIQNKMFFEHNGSGIQVNNEQNKQMLIHFLLIGSDDLLVPTIKYLFGNYLSFLRINKECISLFILFIKMFFVITIPCLFYSRMIWKRQVEI